MSARIIAAILFHAFRQRIRWWPSARENARSSAPPPNSAARLENLRRCRQMLCIFLFTTLILLRAQVNGQNIPNTGQIILQEEDDSSGAVALELKN